MLPDSLPVFLSTYRDGLLNDTVPFWLEHAIDREYGGYFNALDRDGAILQTDKAVWIQARFAWLLSTLYSTVEPRPEWLELARHGIDFLNAHCFDSDGRMFFWVTRDGKPLRKRRYLYSECFAVMALSAYGVASQDPHSIQQASELFRLILHYHSTPGLLPPKTMAETRRMKSLTMPAILLGTAQELCKAVDDPIAVQAIDGALAEIERDFLKPEYRCTLETVGAQGELIDTFEGRMVCPGHGIETAWFILEEARRRQRHERLMWLGATILDWAMERGWDEEHGGLFYYRDARGLPSTEYWHDMKFWWPHNEAIIATLLAWQLTGDPRYARWHQTVHDWAYAHFPDPVHGEWYGYLHRDGSLSTRLKGNMWKGPFHLPRMQWYCWQRLEEVRREGQTAWTAPTPGYHMPES